MTITRGTANALIDGVTVKKSINTANGRDVTYYFLDDTLLLQVEMNFDTMEYEPIVKAHMLTMEERKILERLLERLGLQVSLKIVKSNSGFLIVND